MPVYECFLPTCPNQYTDGTPRKRMYCTAHRDHEYVGTRPVPVTVQCAAPGCNYTYIDPHPLKGTTYYCHRHVIPQPMLESDPKPLDEGSLLCPSCNSQHLAFNHINPDLSYWETTTCLNCDKTWHRKDFISQSNHILTCRFPGCRETTPLDEFEHEMKKWFCEGHKWAMGMTDQEIAEHLAEFTRPGIICDAEDCNKSNDLFQDMTNPGTFYCLGHTIQQAMAMVHRQTANAHLPPLTRVPDEKPVAEMNWTELREHIALREEYHETDKQYKDLDIKKFHAMADLGMAALIKIHSDPDNEATELKGIKLVRWGENIAKEAIDAIRKVRDV